MKKYFILLFVPLFLIAQIREVNTSINSSAADTTGIAVRIFIPEFERYESGCPVVISVPGGWSENKFDTDDLYLDYGIITIQFLFPGSVSGIFKSGGVYDTRGINCVKALGDVIKFALGTKTDKDGYYLNDLTNPITVDYSNVGLFGSSNGGNLTLTTSGHFATEINTLSWIVNYESPVGDGMPTKLAGGKIGEDDYYLNPIYNPAYDTITGTFDFSKLSYCDSLIVDITSSDTVRGNFYFDINSNGLVDEGSDYITSYIIAGSPTPGFYYRWPHSVISNAYKDSILPFPVPSHIPDSIETDIFWKYRDGSRWIDSVTTKIPNLAFLVTAKYSDHVQTAPNHPHIINQYSPFNTAGKFCRINPDRTYLEHVYGSSQPTAKDNDAMFSFDYSNIKDALEPDVLNTSLIKRAAVLEMCDRKHFNNYNSQLDSMMVGVENTVIILNDFYLLQNYPNPFNPTTKIRYSIPPQPSPYQWEGLREGFITLKIYDILGQEIQTLVNEKQSPGNYEVEFNADGLPSGIYFYKLNVDGNQIVKKMIYLK